MTAPDGWLESTLGDVAKSIRNGLFARRPNDEGRGTAILRISAVKAGRVDVLQPRFVEGVTDDQVEKFAVDPGDLLMTRYNGSRHLVGVSGVVPEHAGPILHPDKLIRLVVDVCVVDPRFLNYQLQTQRVRSFLEPRIRTTAGQSGISGRDVREVPLVVPPLIEQRRIVEILEDHLSRLDNALTLLVKTLLRLRTLTRSVLLDLIPDRGEYPSHWTATTVGEAGRVELGRQRHPDWHTGPNMRPYLRVANVFEDRIDTSDVMEMHWPAETFERFRLHPGDVLLNEGQSPEWLGRPAIYRGVPENIAFTNSLIRFKAGDGVLPEFALLVFRRHMHAGRFTRESRITTNIAHLSARRLKAVEFPIPPIDEQRRIVAVAGERLGAVSRLRDEVERGRARETTLRRSLLAAAFSGRLTGESSDVDHVEELAEAGV